MCSRLCGTAVLVTWGRGLESVLRPASRNPNKVRCSTCVPAPLCYYGTSSSPTWTFPPHQRAPRPHSSAQRKLLANPACTATLPAGGRRARVRHCRAGLQGGGSRHQLPAVRLPGAAAGGGGADQGRPLDCSQLGLHRKAQPPLLLCRGAQPSRPRRRYAPLFYFPEKGFDLFLPPPPSSRQDEVVAYVRRRSSAFSRGKSRFRGVSGHEGRWEARIGSFQGRKNVSLGGGRAGARAVMWAGARVWVEFGGCACGWLGRCAPSRGGRMWCAE